MSIEYMNSQYSTGEKRFGWAVYNALWCQVGGAPNSQNTNMYPCPILNTLGVIGQGLCLAALPWHIVCCNITCWIYHMLADWSAWNKSKSSCLCQISLRQLCNVNFVWDSSTQRFEFLFRTKPSSEGRHPNKSHIGESCFLTCLKQVGLIFKHCLFCTKQLAYW